MQGFELSAETAQSSTRLPGTFDAVDLPMSPWLKDNPVLKAKVAHENPGSNPGG
jgi:hypothetical protein